MFCLSLTLIATTFKVMHLPGAGILVLVSLSSMALIFLPIVLGSALKATNDKLLQFVYVAAFISFSVDFIGMIFKILHWPGAGLLMVIGLPLPFVLFMPAYIIYHNQRKLKTDLKFFGIIGFMIYLGVFSSFLAVDVSSSALNGHVKAANSLSTTNQYIKQCTPNYRQNDSNDLIKQIDLFKENLILLYEDDQEHIKYSSGSFDYSMVINKREYCNWDKFQNAGFNAINTSLNNYFNTLDNEGAEISRLIDEINTYRLPKFDDEPLISKLRVIAVLNMLTDWQNKLLLIEYYQTTSI